MILRGAGLSTQETVTEDRWQSQERWKGSWITLLSALHCTWNNLWQMAYRSYILNQ